MLKRIIYTLFFALFLLGLLRCLVPKPPPKPPPIHKKIIPPNQSDNSIKPSLQYGISFKSYSPEISSNFESAIRICGCKLERLNRVDSTFYLRTYVEQWNPNAIVKHSRLQQVIIGNENIFPPYQSLNIGEIKEDSVYVMVYKYRNECPKSISVQISVTDTTTNLYHARLLFNIDLKNK